MQLAVMQPDLITLDAATQAAPAIKALKAANIAPEVRVLRALCLQLRYHSFRHFHQHACQCSRC
jgi:hypothetical protein